MFVPSRMQYGLEPSGELGTKVLSTAEIKQLGLFVNYQISDMYLEKARLEAKLFPRASFDEKTFH